MRFQEEVQGRMPRNVLHPRLTPTRRFLLLVRS